MQSVASIPTGKGRPCPRRQCKVGPQAVYGKIILAGGSGIFPKNPAQPGHAPFDACGMEPTGSTKHNYKNGKNESQRG